MSKIEVLPYFRPTADRMIPKVWVVESPSEHLPIVELPFILDQWDPGFNFSSYIDLECDVSGVFEDCKLSRNSKVILGATWYSSGTNLSGEGDKIVLSPQNAGFYSGRIYLAVPGDQVSKTIELKIALVLLENDAPKPLSPKLPGTILWQQSQSITLPNNSGRFPTEVIDFSKTEGLSSYSNAVWYLDWDKNNLFQSVLKDIRLYINKANDRVRNAVIGGEFAEGAIVDTIRYEVGRMWILNALANEDFLENPYQFPPGSVGFAVYKLIDLLFPRYSLRDLKHFSQNGTRFEVMLQDGLNIFGENK